MKKILTAFLLTLSLISPIYAQDITVDELLGEPEEDEIAQQDVEQLDQERTEEIENELNISIPEYTDNPSYIITFTDPSEEEAGVELDIDESGYKDINSPYSLPSLRIGEHRLKFRFIDSIGATKVLEYDIVIIPRPPVVKAPEFIENNLVISGIGLANSEVVLTISVDANNYTQIAEIDGDGNWNTTVEMEDTYKGIYTIFGYTRKDGYASNPSDPAVLEFGAEGVINKPETDNSDISFNLSSIQFSDIPGVIVQNPDLIIVIVSSLLLGGLVVALLSFLINRVKGKAEEDKISRQMNNGKPKKEKTLRELFESDNEEKVEEKKEEKEEQKKQDKRKKKKKSKKVKKEKKEEESKKETEEDRKKKEKIFTRHDFLKDFEKFDPDKDSGKEKKEPSKKDKKDVLVTLTSPRGEEE
jgi:hypothetical protein